MAGLLLFGRRADRPDAVAARVPFGGEALDRPALPRCVPALDGDDGALLVHDMGDEDTGQPLLQLVERVAIMALELGAPLVIGEVDAHPSALTVRPERSRGAYVMSPCQRPSTTRSEEHTSEIQSLMRISYAVFCLNKKTQ